MIQCPRNGPQITPYSAGTAGSCPKEPGTWCCPCSSSITGREWAGAVWSLGQRIWESWGEPQGGRPASRSWLLSSDLGQGPPHLWPPFCPHQVLLWSLRSSCVHQPAPCWPGMGTPTSSLYWGSQRPGGPEVHVSTSWKIVEYFCANSPGLGDSKRNGTNLKLFS